MKFFSLPIALLIAVFHSEAQVNFQTLPWNEARQQAATANKYILMDCSTDWCVWCRRMEQEVFPDRKVSSLLNEKFLLESVDMEKGEGPVLSLKYRVLSYPTYLIFNPKGKLVYAINGYRQPDEFFTLLTESLDPAKQTNYKGVTDNLNLSYPDFALKFIDGRYRNQLDSTVTNGYLDYQTDLFNEVNWTVLSMLTTSRSRYANFIFIHRDQYSDLYGKQEVEEVMLSILGRRLNKAIRDTSEEQLNELVFLADKYLTDRVSQMKAFYRITFFKEGQDYDKMMNALDDYARIDSYQRANVYNSCAWRIYLNCENPQLVKRSVKHMENVTRIEKAYAEMDTYAALLYKDHQYDMAEKTANQAIVIGKEKGEDVSATEELLEKIKQAKQ